MRNGPVVIVLAAGHGTRMRSATPKMLHELCGRPLVRWPVQAALTAGAHQVRVVGGPDRALAPALPADGAQVALVVQQEARGTGDAVRSGLAGVDPDATVIVLNGDGPLITSEAIGALAHAHARARVAATMLTMELDDPSGYGRVVRGADGAVQGVVETKVAGDATPEQLAVREVNTGIFAFAAGPLLDALARLGADNAQGEQYLPDVLGLLRAAGLGVSAMALDDPDIALGVNDRVDLARVRAIAQRRIHERHMRAGVTIVEPVGTLIEAEVQIAADTVVLPGTSLRGATRVGAGARIGPHTTAIDATIGERVSAPHSYLVECQVGPGASVGPFAYLRPGAVLEEGAKAGTFVEIKNAHLGAGAKVPHLSYVGDADVGEGANLGASTITANYDGRRKHRTTVGRRVRTSVHTTLVAPVRVGDDAYTGANSAVTEDVPPGALAITRPRQHTVEGYAERRRAEP